MLQLVVIKKLRKEEEGERRSITRVIGALRCITNNKQRCRNLFSRRESCTPMPPTHSGAVVPFTSANHETVLHIQRSARRAPRHFQVVCAHLLGRGAINHLHSPPPVSLCHGDQLDQSARRGEKTRGGPLMSNWPIRCDFLMLIYEAASLGKAYPHVFSYSSRAPHVKLILYPLFNFCLSPTSFCYHQNVIDFFCVR